MSDLSGKYLKCGSLYIKFGDDGHPDYGFSVDGTSIREFHNLRNDSEPKEIMLPPIVTKRLERFLDDEFLKYMKENRSKDLIDKYSLSLDTYLKGYVDIGENCFRNLKDKKIIITTDYPIRFEDGAFFRCENISFALPKNQMLYNVHECWNGYFDYEHSDWNFIGHKSFPCSNLDAGASNYTLTKNSKYETSISDTKDF